MKFPFKEFCIYLRSHSPKMNPYHLRDILPDTYLKLPRRTAQNIDTRTHVKSLFPLLHSVSLQNQSVTQIFNTNTILHVIWRIPDLGSLSTLNNDHTNLNLKMFSNDNLRHKYVICDLVRNLLTSTVVLEKLVKSRHRNQQPVSTPNIITYTQPPGMTSNPNWT